jgi:hypothetical protein
VRTHVIETMCLTKWMPWFYIATRFLACMIFFWIMTLRIGWRQGQPPIIPDFLWFNTMIWNG